jgi:hypothetical protein
MIADFLGAVLLAVYALIIGPLGVLRGPIVFERIVWYLWVLLPQGLLTRSIRTAIDWRLGNFDSTIAQLEGIVGASEDYFKDKPGSRARKRVLEDMYTVLVRAYLHAGHIDDAMLVIIRAKKCLGVERLGGLAEIDAKTAHLVRAGLAAGRLLDGGGLATMFVKTSATPSDDNKKQETRRKRRDFRSDDESRRELPAGRKTDEPRRQGASARDMTEGLDVGEDDADEGGKVIPFRPREPVL